MRSVLVALRSTSFWIAIVAIFISTVLVVNNSNNNSNLTGQRLIKQLIQPLYTTISTTTTTMGDETKMRTVLINIAMEAEATPFIEHLNLQKLDDYFPNHLPFVAYRGIYQESVQVTLITNGKDTVYNTDACNVGTIAAATITMMALHNHVAPDVYINAGTAGGFQRNGAQIGDIYVVSSFAFHDRRIPIPGYDTYGTGQSNSTMNVNEFINYYKDDGTAKWKSGICTTGDSLDKTTECDTIMEQNNASVKDMEGAAIAWVVAMHPTIKKFTSIKVITDIVDGTKPTQDEFLANLHKASEQLQHALPMVLDYIAAKDLDEL